MKTIIRGSFPGFHCVKCTWKDLFLFIDNISEKYNQVKIVFLFYIILTHYIVETFKDYVNEF